MKKLIIWFPQNLYLLLVIQVMLGILIAVERELVDLAEDSKVLGVTESSSHSDFKSAPLEDCLKDLKLGPGFLKENRQEVEVPETMKSINERRTKFSNEYQKVLANFENLIERHRSSIDPKNLMKFEDMMEYFYLLNYAMFQKLVTNRINYKDLQLRFSKLSGKIEESEFSIPAIENIIYEHLKDLIINEPVQADSYSSFSKFYLSMTKYLLEQNYITTHQSLEIFQNEKAIELLASRIEKLAKESSDNEIFFFSSDFLDNLMYHNEISTEVTLILQSLGVREKKMLLVKLLKFYEKRYRLSSFLESPQEKLQILEESYKTLLDENADIGDWLKKNNDFNFMAKMGDPYDDLYHLPLYHILKAHMKFNENQLSKAAIENILLLEKTFVKETD